MTNEIVAWGYVSRDTGRLLTMHPVYFGKPGDQDGYDLRPLCFADAPLDPDHALREACQRMVDDYQTSDTHHRNHVLVRADTFFDIRDMLCADTGRS